MKRYLPFLVVALPWSWAHADEAITRLGQRLSGVLHATHFLPSQATKPLPLDRLRLVRFPEFPAAVPRCRAVHHLVIAGDQRLTCELLGMGPGDVQVRTITGDVLTLARRHLQGIVQADDYLIQLLDDFEGPTNALQWTGKPVFDMEHVLSGVRSLRVGAADVHLRIPIPQSRAGARRASLHFYDPGKRESCSSAWTFQLADRAVSMTVYLGSQGYSLDQKTRLQASLGWHFLQVDWDAEKARVFVDDYYLGSVLLGGAVHLTSLRFVAPESSRMWFDAFHLAQRVESRKRMPGPPDLDEIWLASGEQVFGNLLGADVTGIVLAAPYGKRTYPWAHVRGFFFGTGGKSSIPGSAVTVHCRSAPGLSGDRLKGEVKDLTEQHLLLRHSVLGDMKIARTRLVRLAFPEKN